MNFGPNIMSFGMNNQMDNRFKILLKKLKRNDDLNKMKKLVNSILPVDKYRLLKRFLSVEERLSSDIILKCLPVFLDERTTFFSLSQYTDHQAYIKTILEIILRCCPNIQTIDLRNFFIKPENKQNLETFLKQSTSLKSLRVRCRPNNCAIRQLLLEEEFNLHDKDIKDGLLKIEYILGLRLSPSECARLLILLPNLKCLGICQDLGPLLSAYSEDEEILQKLSNIIEFSNHFASLRTLERFVNLCPKAQKIYLFRPEKKVVENLWKFPLITHLELNSIQPDFFTELYNLLKIIGRQIKSLILDTPDEMEHDRNMLHELCPELLTLEINVDQF